MTRIELGSPSRIVAWLWLSRFSRLLMLNVAQGHGRRYRPQPLDVHELTGRPPAAGDGRAVGAPREVGLATGYRGAAEREAGAER